MYKQKYIVTRRGRQQKKSGRIRQCAGVLMVILGGQLACQAQITNSVYPSADAFVRELAPEENYGGAGAVTISGSDAVNAMGQTNGLADTFMRFPTADVAAAMNTQYGSNGWTVTSIVLTANENGMPNNPVFTRGVGAFEIRWIATNNWIEGTGTPNMITSDGVVYDDVAGLLNPALDVSVGVFTNAGVTTMESFSLALAGPLVSNILVGADVDFYLTAASTTVGFTFNSRNYIVQSDWPTLNITVVPSFSPRINSIALTGPDQVSIQFNTASNWTYVVQGSALAGGGTWSNLSTNPAQPFDDKAVFLDAMTNQQRFYRLNVSQP
jgi:hypothetical protein